MSLCNDRSEPAFKPALMFTVLGLGVMSTLGLMSWFLLRQYQWEKNSEDRTTGNTRNTIMRISVVCLVSMFVERSLRIVEFWVKYEGLRVATLVIHAGNNLVTTPGIYVSLLCLLISKLQRTFENTIYEVKVRYVRLLQLLTAVTLISIYVYLVFNAIPPNQLTDVERALAVLFLLLIFISSLSALMIIDVAFTRRLRSVVVASASHHRTHHEKVSSVDSDISMDEVTKTHTLSVFASSQQRLLKTSIKSSLMAYLISLSITLLIFAGLLFLFGRCSNLAAISGQLLMSLAYVLIGVSILFGFQLFDAEYQVCCSIASRWIQKSVVIKTNDEILSQN